MKIDSLKLIKTSCLVVSLGWMLVWFILPMEVYTYEWLPKLSKRFNPTYFGEQGTTLFLLTFPVMLVALLGSLYLYTKSKNESNSSTKSATTSHRHVAGVAKAGRPLLVMGPLGVITATELAFFVMGIFFVCWHFGNYYFVGAKHPYMVPGQPETRKPWQIKFRSVALRIGYASNISWAFVFFPVIRLNSLLPLIGLTYESSIKYHIWIGQVVMVTSALHSLGFIVYWALMNQMREMLGWSELFVSNIAGEISWVFLIAMWITSFAYTRRKSFELFFYTHQLYILATLFYVIHVGVTWTCQILPGIFLFSLDRYLRFLQSRSHVQLISTRLLPGGTVEMTFSKTPDVRYGVTSSLFVCAPKISKLQWHPFTISSNDNMERDTLSIVFKIGGSWTTKIHKELSSSIDTLRVSVEGPYGPASTSFLEHESLVLISGGSGITPFISIIREIIYQANNNDNKTKKSRVLLVCAFKTSADLTMLDLLLPIGGTSDDLSNIDLQIKAYVTQENQPPNLENQPLIQTKWFKPSPLDSPITPVLGPNSWLYLGLLIASSFVLFLVLLALITEYHINPVALKTGVVYHFTYWVLWEMFAMCLGIIVAASVGFLLQKRKFVGDEKQVSNVDVPTPTTSPGSWLSSGNDVYLESAPYQSLVQSTQVQYGRRPNLQEILSECTGNDIGVIASGPRGLRHDAARICSCFGPKNLHYEYLSFNW